MDYGACTLLPPGLWGGPEDGSAGILPDAWADAGGQSHAPFLGGARPGGAGGEWGRFLSGCTLGCLYCQNEEISAGGLGREWTSRDLRRAMEELIAQGAENIDLVTPTHFLPEILPALTPKLPVPVVYNCGGYESVETLRHLEGLVDIYLPDLKYACGALSARLSGAGDYFPVAAAAIGEMVRQTGPCQMERERLRRGVLIRHLILPGQVENSLRVLDSDRGDLPQGDGAGVSHASVYAHAPGGRAAASGPAGHPGGV